MNDKDTIYRQAAIEEWKNDFKGYVNALNIPRDDYNGICAESVDRKLVYKEMEYIDELPSAQSEIMKCKDCKHKPSGSGANHDISFPDEVCPCQCEDYWYSWMPKDDWFCGSWERREDGRR